MNLSLGSGPSIPRTGPQRSSFWRKSSKCPRGWELSFLTISKNSKIFKDFRILNPAAYWRRVPQLDISLVVRGSRGNPMGLPQKKKSFVNIANFRPRGSRKKWSKVENRHVLVGGFWLLAGCRFTVTSFSKVTSKFGLTSKEKSRVVDPRRSAK